MIPIIFGATFSLPLFGKDHLARAASSMAVTLCEPYRHSKRYKQMVEYYSWKLENRYQRNIAYKGFAVCHDAVVCWALAFQLLRMLQLAQHVFTVLK